MNKQFKKILISLLIIVITVMSGVGLAYAEGSQPPAPPEGGGGPGGEPPGGFGGGPGGGPEGGPGGTSAADISYSGVTEFTTDTTESGQSYSSSGTNEQVLLFTAQTQRFWPTAERSTSQTPRSLPTACMPMQYLQSETASSILQTQVSPHLTTPPAVSWSPAEAP